MLMLLLWLLALTFPLTAKDAVIHAGRMVDVESKQAKNKVIDLADFTVLPVLIDCHKHISMHPANPNRFEDLVTERSMFRLALKSGVKIAFGTDTGASFRTGGAAKELAEMVRLGMPPMEALVSATRAAAELIGAGREIGTISPGS